MALLLPWYLSETLSEEERLLLEDHLLSCAACREELASVSTQRQHLRAVFANALVPAASLHERVMGGVRAPPPARERPTSPLKAVADLFQALIRPGWTSTAAVVLIVLQAGMLSWLLIDDRMRDPTSSVTTRSVEPAITQPRIRVVFNPSATEQDIRTALLALGGRVVDGPTADAGYVIQLPAEAPTVLAQRLRELRERPGLVERIENVQ
jgi:anti-sigma factor RsiW